MAARSRREGGRPSRIGCGRGLLLANPLRLCRPCRERRSGRRGRKVRRWPTSLRRKPPGRCWARQKTRPEFGVRPPTITKQPERSRLTISSSRIGIQVHGERGEAHHIRAVCQKSPVQAGVGPHVVDPYFDGLGKSRRQILQSKGLQEVVVELMVLEPFLTGNTNRTRFTPFTFRSPPILCAAGSS